MSTDFRLLKRILASDLLDGRLEAFGVRERVALDHESVLARTPETYRCLTDGHNYVWFGVNDDGCVGWITRYGLEDSDDLDSTALDALAIPSRCRPSIISRSNCAKDARELSMRRLVEA
jgi:hypothetical protein